MYIILKKESNRKLSGIRKRRFVRGLRRQLLPERPVTKLEKWWGANVGASRLITLDQSILR
jgi:hypothetical protein